MRPYKITLYPLYFVAKDIREAKKKVREQIAKNKVRISLIEDLTEKARMLK